MSPPDSNDARPSAPIGRPPRKPRLERPAWAMRLRAARAKAGISQARLADLICPDVRAITRLFMRTGIPLEWIYVGRLAHVDYGRAQTLEQAAAQIGAAVGMP